jgi:hypothetical protein
MATKVTGHINVWLFCECPGRPHNRHHGEFTIDELVIGDHKEPEQIAVRQKLGEQWKLIEDMQWIDGPELTPVGEDVAMIAIGAPKLFEF